MTQAQASIAGSQLNKLLVQVAGEQTAADLFTMIKVEDVLLAEQAGDSVSRLVLAQAMNMLLFAKNLEAVPEGKRYVADKLAAGGQVVFDHGALRTVAAANTGAIRFYERMGLRRLGGEPGAVTFVTTLRMH